MDDTQGVHRFLNLLGKAFLGQVPNVIIDVLPRLAKLSAELLYGESEKSARTPRGYADDLACLDAVAGRSAV